MTFTQTNALIFIVTIAGCLFIAWLAERMVKACNRAMDKVERLKKERMDYLEAQIKTMEKDRNE
jgi:threonine/homoserine/homoserine lactone efflux protein